MGEYSILLTGAENLVRDNCLATSMVPLLGKGKEKGRITYKSLCDGGQLSKNTEYFFFNQVFKLAM